MENVMIKIWKQENKTKDIKHCEVCGKLIRIDIKHEVICNKCRIWKANIIKENQEQSG